MPAFIAVVPASVAVVPSVVASVLSSVATVFASVAVPRSFVCRICLAWAMFTCPVARP